ncbi:hypothetical protein D7Y13_43365, partial [Corallococcus praedator]
LENGVEYGFKHGGFATKSSVPEGMDGWTWSEFRSDNTGERIHFGRSSTFEDVKVEDLEGRFHRVRSKGYAYQIILAKFDPVTGDRVFGDDDDRPVNRKAVLLTIPLKSEVTLYGESNIEPIPVGLHGFNGRFSQGLKDQIQGI